ncbi:MAG TPA: hypothetical protein VK590_10785, partial [Saprospiraceae bacterium]|nr:hypothetical protein [Saprospiraceae bacterium]
MVRLAIISFILFVPFNLISQVETKLDTLNYIRDTLHKNDTVPLYKNIKNLAANSKIANLIYQALFKEPGQNTPSPIICTDKYSYYQGRKIGKIKIVVLDPFGNIRGDSVAVPISVLEIIGNKTHMTTRNWVIKDLLLFKTGESLDSLKLIESERLIRLAGGNRDARINIICPFDDDNKIDILVVVRDQFSITGGVGIGGDTQDFSIEDNNFLGLSNQLSTKIGFHAKEPKGTSFDGHYLVSNISNSYISGIVTYSSSSFHRRAGISFDRAFVTPLIKWAGGVNLSFMKTYWPFDSSGTTATEPLNFMMLDNWIARSFSLRAKNINEYSEPKLILGARYSRLEYEEKPSYEFDFNKINQNTSLYLASIAYSERGYYKDINIFRFDRIEDVPKGKLATLTLGYESKELSRRPYIGLKLASGDHISKFGYLAGKMEFGALINKGSSEQGVFNTTVNYLTDLWKYKNW